MVSEYRAERVHLRFNQAVPRRLLSRLPVACLGVSPRYGVDPIVSLLIISHASLIAAFALTLAYVRLRFPDEKQELGEYVLLSLGLFPTALFFRMVYSESLFVFLLVLCLYGMERRWSLLLLALLVGFATATRPVGLALLPPFVLHVWHRSASRQQFGIRLAWLLPLSLWGIAAYMGYQWLTFGEPLAFLKTQGNWRVYRPSSLSEKASRTCDPQAGLGQFRPFFSGVLAAAHDVSQPLRFSVFYEPLILPRRQHLYRDRPVLAMVVRV